MTNDDDDELRKIAKAAKRRRSRNTLALVTYIGNQREWDGALRFNLLTDTLEVHNPFPPNGTASHHYRPLSEPGDILEAMLWAQANGFPKASKTLTQDVLTVIAQRHSFHPVRDYLDALQWDGKQRLPRLFLDYFNAALPSEGGQEEQAERIKIATYLEGVGRCWLVSAVARIYDPGCKVDHLPVLVSEEAFNKSEAIRTLCPDPAWFSDDLPPDLVERDSKDSLVGKWLIELPEIPHARREVERVKAFFSRRTDRFRRAYHHLTRDWPRTAVFIGTSNDLELLSATGNRRFWPIELTGPIDIAKLLRDRDQLWAEAVHDFRAGCKWWLSPETERIAAEQQAAFTEADIWDDLIAAWTGPPLFTLQLLFAEVLGNEDGKQIPKADQNRATTCLKRLGFRRRREYVSGKRTWLWRKKPLVL